MLRQRKRIFFTHESGLSMIRVNWQILGEQVVKKHGYRKIPKIGPGAYIFQRPFLRGLYSKGLIYGGKFAFQNRLG